MLMKDASIAYTKQLVRMQCCALFLLVLMVAGVMIIAYFLSQDSDTMDVMAERLNAYMDEIDEAKPFQLLKDAHSDYDAHVSPSIERLANQIVEVANMTHAVVKQAHDIDIVNLMRKDVNEIQDLLAYINETIKTIAVNVDIHV